MVGCFIDDLAVGGNTHEEAAAHAALLFAMLEERHLLAGADKVFVGLETIAFLGFQLTGGTVSPDPEKTAAISRLLPPRTRTEVRGFLGLTGYYREFVLRYAHLAKPLNLLLKEDTPWEWSPPCQRAFDDLKTRLMSTPILALPDHDRPYTLHTDFSHLAISAVLEQLKADGKHHVIGYASRTCSTAESKLGPTDGELLAIIYAVEKFHAYIAGTKFVIVTDHHALIHLQTAKTKNAKLARWAMRLAPYDFTLRHRAGRVHNNADGLSRARAAPSPDMPPADVIALDAACIANQALFAEAFEVFANDDNLDGDEATPAERPPAPAAALGPRQLLLESAPCATCHNPFTPTGASSVVCDRCNRPYHLRCTRLHRAPATYWYCRECAAHIRARGYMCPTEDVALQTYLLTGTAPPRLRAAF